MSVLIDARPMIEIGFGYLVGLFLFCSQRRCGVALRPRPLLSSFAARLRFLRASVSLQEGAVS